MTAEHRDKAVADGAEIADEHARLAATPTEPPADASFDDSVLTADPAPTWTGGLLGMDRPENQP